MIDDCELIVTSCIESLIIGDDFIPDISSLILNYSLISLKRIEIGDGCFKNVNQFVIDGLNELETIIIGYGCFRNVPRFMIGNRKESKCLIMNCDQLREIHIGKETLEFYDSFELKNLPSLISIQLDDYVFCNCQRIVFDSMNDWMNDEWDLIRLQSITLKLGAFTSKCGTIESNELIMKSMNDNDWLIRSPFSDYIQRR